MESSRNELVLPEKQQKQLLKVIATLCSDKNLAYINEQLPVFDSLVDNAKSLDSLDKIKLPYMKISTIVEFFTELLSYANHQQVLIDEKLEISTRSTLDNVATLLKKLEAAFKAPKNKAHQQANVGNSTFLKARDKLEESLAKIDSWLHIATNKLLKKELFLPIVHAQLKIFENEMKKKELQSHCEKISSQALFNIRTRDELAKLIDGYLQWLSANKIVISGLKTTMPLLNSISSILLSLLNKDINEFKKYTGFQEHAKEIKGLLTTTNLDIRNIHDMLGIEKKIKQRNKHLRSIVAVQNNPTTHSRLRSLTLSSSQAGDLETPASQLLPDLAPSAPARDKRMHVRRQAMAENRGYSAALLFKVANRAAENHEQDDTRLSSTMPRLSAETY